MLIPRELTESECLEKLAGQNIGRVGFCTADGPRVFPVNYAMDGGSVVFRTSPYGLIARESGQSGTGYGPIAPAPGAQRDAAFEIDHFDDQEKTGWSVLVVGSLKAVEDPHELLSLTENPQPWAGGSRGLYLRLHCRQISGRAVEAPGR
jgi:nitroimidazol reductase NimA-like FMN-containing flavoprotein (pyridoxamine 5'-phosphate oxidase superfamily)